MDTLYFKCKTVFLGEVYQVIFRGNAWKEREIKMSEIKPIREKWRGTMSGRERFNRQINFQSVDRSVNREFGFWKENFDLWEIFKKTI